MRRILTASLATMALAIAPPGSAAAAVTLQPGADNTELYDASGLIHWGDSVGPLVQSRPARDG